MTALLVDPLLHLLALLPALSIRLQVLQVSQVLPQVLQISGTVSRPWSVASAMAAVNLQEEHVWV